MQLIQVNFISQNYCKRSVSYAITKQKNRRLWPKLHYVGFSWLYCTTSRTARCTTNSCTKIETGGIWTNI